MIRGEYVADLSDSQEILLFLNKSKKLLSNNKYDFVPRRKNLQDLAATGLSITDAKSEILSLTLDDYYRGPKEDFDSKRPGQIWEFKKKISNKVFYIKLKIVNENDCDILKCLSFHKDQYTN